MPKRPRIASPDDSILDSDEEVDEFAGAGLEHDSEGDEDPGVSQWQPDSWDADSQDEDDDSDGEEGQLQSLQGGLSSVPLSTLAKAHKALRRGQSQVSTYQEGESSRIREVKEKLAALQGQKRSDGQSQDKASTRISRQSKHAPTAISSKRQVTRLRQVVELPKTERRDPRFSGLSAGSVDLNIHQQSYSFLPDILKKEHSEVRTALAAASKAERTCALSDRDSWTAERERLEASLARIRTRIDRTERESRERDALAKAKKEEMEKRKQGKGAWYMKKGDKRDLLLRSKFEALEADGGKNAVKKAMDKKRKKEASKAKKSRPSIDSRSDRRRA